MGKKVDKLLCPNTLIGFLIFNFSFGSLIYVFSNHLEKTVLAYISYAGSFYVLILFMVWFYQAGKFSHESVKNSKAYHVYQNHPLRVAKLSMWFSLAFHLIYGVIKLGIGLYNRSWWFIIFAIYYLLLCFMKLSLVKGMDNQKKGYQKLKHTGMMLLLLNMILTGMIILIIRHDRIIHYEGFFIYLAALYDFFLMIRAIISVIKHRNNHNPVIVSGKCINLTVAMISMVSLEVAMVDQFGNNDAAFKLIMTSSMGIAICIINSLMALSMIIRANQYLK